MEDCVFCKITQGVVQTDFHYKSDHVVAFSDINPVAPVHVLIIPTEHIASVDDLKNDHSDVIAEMFFVARDLARERGIMQTGHKLLIRTGHDGGQEVPHIHLHLIGGAALSEDIHPK
jgi:histidine triad (HIT) family protein